MVALLKMPNRFTAAASDERRMFPRKDVQYHVESRRRDHSAAAQQQPQLSLSLRDLSLGGLAAISDVPLQPGEKLSVFFPPSGANRGWDAHGRVIRCNWTGNGYRIAVEFDPIPMAA
jgi:hypothetical protein